MATSFGKDRWLGTPNLPGYRAGDVVAKLDDLPDVDPHHLYFDLLLLDKDGRFLDNHSGTCLALARTRSLDERSRFVRVVAELARHVSMDPRGLAVVGQAVTLIRERGIETGGLVLAAQILDMCCNDDVVVASLMNLLEMSMGNDEAMRTMCEVVTTLARESGCDKTEQDRALEIGVGSINGGGLKAQVSYVVRTVSKARARAYLREVTYFNLVPTPDLLGV